MSIVSLGYIGVEASDLAGWKRLTEEVLGADVTEAGSDLLVRIDEKAWRLRISSGAADDIAYLGWECRGPEAFHRVVTKLAELGVSAAPDPEVARQRGVLELARFVDPAGLACELYWGATDRFESPPSLAAGVSGFVTGSQGLGHFAVATSDADATVAFYCALGFAVSDNIDMPFGPSTLPLTFLHCNPRHHTMAVATAELPHKCVHLMLQYAELDDIGRALERAAASNIPVSMTLGRHTNDHMVSFYVMTPSGFEFEIGWGARTINADWRRVRHDAISTWGHHPLLGPAAH